MLTLKKLQHKLPCNVMPSTMAKSKNILMQKKNERKKFSMERKHACKLQDVMTITMTTMMTLL
jgi:hypothetical protein